MSNETQDWLNSNVLVGFTRERGNAWHWREGTDNHYEDEIPVDDVRRRLFHWEPVKAAMHYFYEDTWKVFPGKSVIIRPKARFDRVALFRAFGRFIEDLRGH